MGLLDHVLYDREQRNAMRWAKLAAGAFVLFVISGAYSCAELNYSVRGVKTAARITGVAPAPVVGPEAVTVRYEWSDTAGKPQSGKYTFERGGFDTPADGQIQIVYLPGWPEANLPTARRRWWAVWTFLGITAVLVAGVAKLLIETAREIRENG